MSTDFRTRSIRSSRRSRVDMTRADAVPFSPKGHCFRKSRVRAASAFAMSLSLENQILPHNQNSRPSTCRFSGSQEGRVSHILSMFDMVFAQPFCVIHSSNSAAAPSVTTWDCSRAPKYFALGHAYMTINMYTNHIDIRVAVFNKYRPSNLREKPIELPSARHHRFNCHRFHFEPPCCNLCRSNQPAASYQTEGRRGRPREGWRWHRAEGQR